MNKERVFDLVIAGGLLTTTMVLGTNIVLDNSSAKEIPTEPNVGFYKDLSSICDPVIVDSEDLTLDMLTNRNGKIIIEKAICEVLDDELNGVDVSTGNYISYKGCNVERGDICVSYFVYNPDTLYDDDIIARYDYVIDSTEEDFD